MRPSPLCLLVLSLALPAGCAPSVPVRGDAPADRSGEPAPPGPSASGSIAACAEPPAAGPAEPDPLRYESLATPRDPADLCEIADSNLAAVESELLARVDAPAAGPKASPWDHRSRLAHEDLVRRRFALTGPELSMLKQKGMAVAARLEVDGYAGAFHEIYQSQLPLYVSIDAILSAVYVSNDALLAEVEQKSLAPLLGRVLGKLACALGAAAGAYPREVARDLDLYLTVARTLLSGAEAASSLGEVSAEAAGLVQRARGGKEFAVLALFGRERTIDFTQFTPRGHYAEGPLRDYFLGAMWLGRLEFNLVSRSSRSSAPPPIADPSETPREAVAALSLADLAGRAGVMDDIGRLDRAFALFAGRREDVTLAQLAELRQAAGIERIEIASFDRLRAAIGQRYPRTTRVHFMPQGTTELPAIATLLGPRIVPDAQALMPLVNPEVEDRYMVGAGDVGFALGHDAARALLGEPLRRFPALGAQLPKARAILTAKRAGEDLYGAWLSAVAGLGERPEGALPSFMRTAAFADMRLNSALAGYAQLKHNFVLMAAQVYDQGGCEIPDAYVEPAPAVYDALLSYAARGERVMAELDPQDQTGSGAYFRRLARVLGVLRVIQNDELRNLPLTASEQRFLSMVAEVEPAGTGGGPTYTGWYFELFRTRDEGLKSPAFIADYFTSAYTNRVAYLGASRPRMGFFVVDTGGAPRVMVGPVASAYEVHAPLERRLSDRDAEGRARIDRQQPWASSYTLPAVAEPRMSLSAGHEGSALEVNLVADAPLGEVMIEALDHHRQPLASLTRRVGKGATVFTLRAGGKAVVEGVHVRVGGFHDWAEVGSPGGLFRAYGGAKLPGAAPP